MKMSKDHPNGQNDGAYEAPEAASLDPSRLFGADGWDDPFAQLMDQAQGQNDYRHQSQQDFHHSNLADELPNNAPAYGEPASLSDFAQNHHDPYANGYDGEYPEHHLDDDRPHDYGTGANDGHDTQEDQVSARDGTESDAGTGLFDEDGNLIGGFEEGEREDLAPYGPNDQEVYEENPLQDTMPPSTDTLKTPDEELDNLFEGLTLQTGEYEPTQSHRPRYSPPRLGNSTGGTEASFYPSQHGTPRFYTDERSYADTFQPNLPKELNSDLSLHNSTSFAEASRPLQYDDGVQQRLYNTFDAPSPYEPSLTAPLRPQSRDAHLYPLPPSRPISRAGAGKSDIHPNLPAGYDPSDFSGLGEDSRYANYENMEHARYEAGEETDHYLEQEPQNGWQKSHEMPPTLGSPYDPPLARTDTGIPVGPRGGSYFPGPDRLATLSQQADPYSTHEPSIGYFQDFSAASYKPQQPRHDRRLSNTEATINWTPNHPVGPYDRPELHSRNTSMPQFDPLNREKGCPVISFGLGGRIVTTYPKTASTNSYLFPSEQGSGQTVRIRSITNFIPDPLGLHSFPGPLFMDAGKNATAIKAKKEKVMEWLSAEIGLTSTFAADLPEQSDKGNEVILLNLVKMLLENGGKLVGSKSAENSIRNLLLPGSAVEATGVESFSTVEDIMAEHAVAHDEEPGTIRYSITPSSLERLATYLMKGDKERAITYAISQRMWAHAQLIASCVSQERWQEVVAQFARSELCSTISQTRGASASMRLLYGLLAGQGPQAVHEQMSLNGVGLSLDEKYDEGQNDLSTSSDCWKEMAATVIANQPAGSEAALAALGDTLRHRRSIAAAHVCYLLATTKARLGGMSLDETRYSLIGHDPVYAQCGLQTQSIAIALTEIVEFASSLTISPKDDPFVGFPHLAAYRLAHAWQIADLGSILQAQRYCEAIAATIKLNTKGSPYLHRTLLNELKSLSDRLAGVLVPDNDRSHKWIGKTIQRPSLDSLWTSLEGRFNKFVVGDSTEDVSTKEVIARAQINEIGPFSHYSSISPYDTSGAISRSGSPSRLVVMRPGSAASTQTYSSESYPPGLAGPPSHEGTARSSFENPHYARPSSPQWIKEESDENMDGVKSKSEAAQQTTAVPEKSETKKENKVAAGGGSWLGKFAIFGGKKPDVNAGGPIKAKLGEESSFYYDKESKRWINKKAGADQVRAETPPPPPPSRARTATPSGRDPAISSRSNEDAHVIPPSRRYQSETPPPLSTSSSSDRVATLRNEISIPPAALSNSNNPSGRSTPSFLIPQADALSSAGLQRPALSEPDRRISSTASRRNLRNRYVDVMNTKPSTPG